MSRDTAHAHAVAPNALLMVAYVRRHNSSQERIGVGSSNLVEGLIT